MIFKKIIVITFAVFVSVSIATAGGPDVTTKPQVKKNKKSETVTKKDEKVMLPIDKERDEQIIKEVAEKDIIPSQPSDNRVVIEKRVVAQTTQARKVSVLFESSPTNAEVLINGLYVGTTPVQLPLYDGVHNVKVIASKHIVWERQFKAYQGLRVFAPLTAEKVEE